MRRAARALGASAALVALASGIAACGRDAAAARDSAVAAAERVAAARRATAAARVDAAHADTAAPAGPFGASVRRGEALFRHTADSLPRNAPGNISCTNCHRDGGRDLDASPVLAAHARYPRWAERAGAVATLADRVNYCLTRSLAGRPLPHDGREMRDILAYMAWLGRGTVVGAPDPDRAALPKAAAALEGDTARGRAVYVAQCASCHGADGAGRRAARVAHDSAGTSPVPALWGAGSYDVGASMAREGRLAAFVWHNMPLGRPRSLTPQQALDVAAYVNARPRRDLAGKANDWPAGNAPADVPYDLRSGHRAHRPPARLLPATR